MPSPLQKIRQSAAELLAMAVCDLFPGALLVEGDATDIGFYYDFIVEQPLDERGIPLIEERIRSLIKAALPFKVTEMMRKNAIEFFRFHDQDIKAEMLSQSDSTLVTVVKIGEFHDLCDGEVVALSNEVGAFKLLEIAPATLPLPDGESLEVVRIQGTAFDNPQTLKKFLKLAESAKRRDHRTLGKEMGLFTTFDDAATGAWFWLPKGIFLKEQLLSLLRSSHAAQHVQLLSTPRFVKPSLLKKGGRCQLPAEVANIFPSFSIEGADYVATPTISPLHALVFKGKLRSYRELPVRYAESAEVYTLGKEARLWGMLRARAYTVDMTHIFCSKEQVYDEMISSLQFIDKTVKIFGFEHHWYLVPPGKKYCGTAESWGKCLELMGKALNECGMDYTRDEEGNGFYGPRAEMRLVDALGREWKGPYVGIDFNLPAKMGLRYQGADDEMHVPMMIVRSLFGSLERFVAILVEHYGGLFPLWLAPEQVRVIPVGEKNVEGARQVLAKVQQEGLRATIDCSSGGLGSKIHAAEVEKVPYMLIVGEKEEKSGLITVRSCNRSGTNSGMSLETFLTQMKQEDIWGDRSRVESK